MPGAPRVLIIDDDEDFRTSTRALLESRGFEVFEAGSGREGLRRLTECHPDLILLDIMMECCSEGYGVNQAIKWRDEYSEFRHIPVIMVSSIQESPDQLFPTATEVAMIRPDYYVTKPLDVPAFLATVERALQTVRAGGLHSG
ncbi:MAG: response regulator [Bryobacterales bacterium]|nr:response regulator [Bryobacterales bacterium]